MIHARKTARKAVKRFLDDLGEPVGTDQDVERSADRLLQRLTVDCGTSPFITTTKTPQNTVPRQKSGSRPALLAAAAGCLLIVGFAYWTRISWPPIGEAAAIAHAFDGTLYTGSNDGLRSLTPGDAIGTGESVRTNENGGAVLELTDGSRVELDKNVSMRIYRESEGVRIDLDSGSIIVRAAPQRDGRLSVKTRDCIASVTGTVFAVNSDSSGSRVSVLEGEVHVLQGATLNVVLPGQQITTNPGVAPVPVEREIAWSRDRNLLATLLALTDTSVAERNGTIEGAVTNGMTGMPLADTSVKLYPKTSAARSASSVTTEGDGRFVLSNVPPGRQYILSAEKDGYIRTNLALALAPGQDLGGIRIPLYTAGVVTGVLADSRGEPIPNARVFPYRYIYGEDGERTPKLMSTSSGITPGTPDVSRIIELGLPQPTTDDTRPVPGRSNSRGEFRVFNLEPGDYVLYVVTPPPLGPFYYPNASNPRDARVVEVKPGTETRLNTITIPNGRSGVLRTRVVHQGGSTGNAIVEVRHPGNTQPILSTRTRPERWTDIGPIPAGRYIVEAFLGLPGNPKPVLYGHATVEIVDRDIEVEVSVNPGALLKGIVMAETAAKSLQPVQGVRLVVASTQIPGLPLAVESGTDGSFFLPNVPAGLFRIRSVTGIPEDLCLADVRQGSRNAQRDGIEVGTAEVGLGLRLGKSEAIVQGVVKGRDDQRVAGATVVLAPDEREASELYRTTITDQNGEFEIRCARPGSFHLYAWRELNGAAYRNAEFMRDFEAKGRAVRIEGGDRSGLTLTVLD